MNAAKSFLALEQLETRETPAVTSLELALKFEHGDLGKALAALSNEKVHYLPGNPIASAK